MKYAIKITEENKEFIGYFFNNGVVPEVEAFPTALVFSDDDEDHNDIVHEWEMVNSTVKKAMIIIFEVHESALETKTEAELKESLIRLDHVQEKIAGKASVFTKIFTDIDLQKAAIAAQLDAISGNGSEPAPVPETNLTMHTGREERDKKILNMAKKGYSYTEIAKQVGLSNQRVSQIIKASK